MQMGRDVTIRLPSGAIITRSWFTMLLVDNEHSKTVTALLPPTHHKFVLWASEDYDAVGDYTQDQAEARLREILGDEPQRKLTAPGLPPPDQVA